MQFHLFTKFSSMEQHIIMVTLRRTAKAPTTRDCEALKGAYDSLRTANEQLQTFEREICFLKTAKMLYFPSQCETSDPDHLLRHKRSGFVDQLLSDSEWLQRVTCNGLLESVDNLARELERISASKTKFDCIQGTLRRCINELSRPYPRDLNILDLPGELLLDIFEIVEDFDFNDLFAYKTPGRADIQNTRLVCRRFVT
ncbi:uncharacterized protein B0H64DRAFT_42266 [Chaetomium fimeti]|uniref:F-box domain-containing protein n=1 Tax=Chaetomium fimeti TaxID=1854472 RepID=A0AAE0LN81_9PEZI|nr:hypothetical protein B0H64DRAFT_42266 [Chaetomium fimeti]